VGHPYRHGFVPTVQMARALASHAAELPKTSAADLNFGGGIDGIGVTTGPPRIYLVFWGTQWGAQGTNGSGDTTFSGDPDGLAPYAEGFFKGLGTGGETWSGVMTQYCQGVATGSQSCPTGSQHVGYPSGGSFAGLWEDTTAAAPAAATAHQIAQEAVSAAVHFGNNTADLNRNVEYDIIFPTGTNPDNYEGQGFCAWHDYTGDATMDGGGAVTTPWGTPIAFTNMPYVPDAGANCGAGFVNAGNNLDGVSIVNGHEFAETVTDQFPAGGWTDSSGEETGDKCAWITPGSGQGAAQNISLTTGSFAVQSTWANDFNSGAGGCEVSHPIESGNTITVTNPGSQTSFVGKALSLQVHASDSASGQTLTYSAASLPTGISINSSSGLISGTPTATGTSHVTVTVSDTTGASGTASFTWAVDPLGVTVTNPGNQTTVVNHAVSLQIHAIDSNTGQTLTYSASGLPAGLSISSSSGLISGTVTTVANSSVVVTAKDGTGTTGKASFSWSVTLKPACTAKQLFGNPGFETGTAAPWVASSSSLIQKTGGLLSSHSGNYFAQLDGTFTPHTDTISQTVSITAGCHTDTLSFWLEIFSLEFTSSAVDNLKVEAIAGGQTTVLATYTNVNATYAYQQYKLNVAKFAGKKVEISFVGTETDGGGGSTFFALDDTSLKEAL
jgi:serine protease